MYLDAASGHRPCQCGGSLIRCFFHCPTRQANILDEVQAAVWRFFGSELRASFSKLDLFLGAALRAAISEPHSHWRLLVRKD
mmetsp:Transcript_64521/g.170841  ORF Transcript_64521/g.170841 Transcript_64521/m.170841 type:complete len:82 (+) Transcript_64521:25-270(+)